MTRVVLAQLPVPEPTPRENTGLVPLGAASLVLHARHAGVGGNVELVVLPGPTLRRFGDARLAAAIVAERPDVVALTVDLWNVERTLALARRLRAELPGLRVWLGGPEVAEDAPLATAATDVFDVAVEGEGELPFLALLQGAEASTLPTARAVGRGVLVPERALGALTDLATLHDPYVEGLVAPEADGVALAELWRGCRYHCTFCRYHAGRHGAGASRPYALVDQLFGWAREHGVRELYLLDPSLEQRPDLDDFLASLAASNRSGLPLFVELRAEAVDEALAGRLRRAGVRGVEVGLQTTHRTALRLAARTFDPVAFVRGVKALEAVGIRARLDVMLGLAGDSEDGLRQTLAFLQEHGLAEHLQLFRTKVLPGTALRAHAGRLGVRYQAEPPYSVVGTPTWPEAQLAGALEVAADVLDRDLGRVEAPVVLRPAWGREAAVRIDWPDADACVAYAFRLDAREGRAALAAERFERAGNVVSLWLEGDDLLPARRGIVAALRRLLAANPFATVTVALVGLPEGPLDPFVDVDGVLDEARPSLYLERLHETPRPERRLVAVLERPWLPQVDPGWLEALRAHASVLWMTRCDDLEGATTALRAVEELADPDALLAAPRSWPDDRDALDRVMADLAAACPAPERVTWSPLELHWAWVRAVERGDGGS